MKKPKSPTTIDLNPQFKHALHTMENTQKHVFVTGRAGTGKSTLLSVFRNQTKKRAVVLAPTGVAAVNVQGQTIHSFFGFRPDITASAIKDVSVYGKRKETYKKLETLVIDEVSMVRADLFDCVDEFLRLHGPKRAMPFGGVQLISIGDLYQLPPVVTSREREIFEGHYPGPYFFNSRAFPALKPEFIELEKIYRQSDERFIALLNSIRNNSAGAEELGALNKRHDPDFEPSGERRYIYLTTTNRGAEAINQQKLSELKGKLYRFKGIVRGKFDTHALPTSVELELKIGAQVMLVNNDSAGRWINGTVGAVVDIDYDDEEEVESLQVELEDGEVVSVKPYTWELYDFRYNRESGSIESETLGSFTQYPVMLAWAVTIHKSQGKTFDRVIVDLERGTFAHGQLYVALSRCTTLEGLVLKKPVKKSHIWMDWRVVKFLTGYQYQISDKALSLDDKIALIKKAISEKRELEITYLKAQDEKSRRKITPQTVGKMEYMGKSYIGVEAYCHSRRDTRVFRVDRILEMKVV